MSFMRNYQVEDRNLNGGYWPTYDGNNTDRKRSRNHYDQRNYNNYYDNQTNFGYYGGNFNQCNADHASYADVVPSSQKKRKFSGLDSVLLKRDGIRTRERRREEKQGYDVVLSGGSDAEKSDAMVARLRERRGIMSFVRNYQAEDRNLNGGYWPTYDGNNTDRKKSRNHYDQRNYNNYYDNQTNFGYYGGNFNQCNADHASYADVVPSSQKKRKFSGPVG
ncbi:hypothetical protein RYX36_026659, partial [Vicia faba]